MKMPILIIGTLLIVTLLYAQTEWVDPPSHDNLKQWQSPKKAITFFIKAKDPKEPFLYEMFLQREKEEPLKVKSTESELRREHMGHGWFLDAKYKWVGERLLVFNNDIGIGVLDVKQARFLINNSFESLVKHSTEDKWIFVRYRGAGRQWDPTIRQDKLGLIELTPEVLKSENPSTSFLDHVRWIELPGLIISPPIWTKNATEIAFLQWIDGKTYLCLHDGKSLKENKRTLVEIAVPKEILESPRLMDDLKPKVESLIK